MCLCVYFQIKNKILANIWHLTLLILFSVTSKFWLFIISPIIFILKCIFCCVLYLCGLCLGTCIFFQMIKSEDYVQWEMPELACIYSTTLELQIPKGTHCIAVISYQ